jgi:hypothetical protein
MEAAEHHQSEQQRHYQPESAVSEQGGEQQTHQSRRPGYDEDVTDGDADQQ